MNYNTTISAAL